MADWRKRARIIGDVVFFEYVTSKLERTSDVVYVWDIDKTYLDTHFETLKGLIRTAMEKAFQKRNIPGSGVLVRSLTASEEGKPFPIYFISASPPQMEKKIRTKLEIDSIKPYGAFFKDNLRNLKPKYFRRLTQHAGFKIQALMELRTRLKDDVKQVLFGDDSESDAVVYSLYSDICAKRLVGSDLMRVLDEYHVIPQQQDAILEIQDRTASHDPVERIYINLANDTDPDYYEKFGKRLLPTFNTFQMALDLFQENRIKDQQLLRVAQDMALNYGFTTDEFGQSFDDMVRRKLLLGSTLEQTVKLMMTAKLIPPHYRPEVAGFNNVEDPRKARSWIPSNIDYLNDFR